MVVQVVVMLVMMVFNRSIDPNDFVRLFGCLFDEGLVVDDDDSK